MDDSAIAVMAVSACISAVYIVKFIADAAVKYRAHEKRATEPALTAASDDRLARLELAVEAIALEVERISEGQRFTTRLLNEQAQRTAPRLERPG